MSFSLSLALSPNEKKPYKKEIQKLKFIDLTGWYLENRFSEHRGFEQSQFYLYQNSVVFILPDFSRLF